MKSLRLASVVSLIALGGGACATKSDIDRLGGEIAGMQIRQDSLIRLLTSVDEGSVLAALAEEQSMILASRADLQRQLNDMERQLVQIQALLGQSQIVLQQLSEQTESRPLAGLEADSAGEGAMNPAVAAAGAAGAALGARNPAAQASAGRTDEPAVLYRAVMEQFRRGAYDTSKTGFVEFLSNYPADELAPDAQLYLAESYRELGDWQQAIRNYERAVQLYPNSRIAPTALYKAGLLLREQGNKDQACEYFMRVLAGYPRSDEARLADDQRSRLSC